VSPYLYLCRPLSGTTTLSLIITTMGMGIPPYIIGPLPLPLFMCIRPLQGPMGAGTARPL